MSYGHPSNLLPNRYHGARVGIVKADVICHDDGYQSQKVTIRSYSDGIRVGCTFISNNALRDIWEMHSKYLDNREDFVQHQSGIM